MRTWDPFSFFKYMTGSAQMHLIMVANIIVNKYFRHFDVLPELTAAEKELNEQRNDLVWNMLVVHLVVFLL